MGGAARRNKVKRLLREAYRKNRYRMEDNREFVILANETCFEKSYKEVEKELVRCLKKAMILCD